IDGVGDRIGVAVPCGDGLGPDGCRAQGRTKRGEENVPVGDFHCRLPCLENGGAVVGRWLERVGRSQAREQTTGSRARSATLLCRLRNPAVARRSRKNSVEWTAAPP